MSNKILIIDDSPIQDKGYKYKNLVKYIKKALPDATIENSLYVNTGYRKLKDTSDYDFVFVDMQMPLLEGGDIELDAGITLLTNVMLEKDDVTFLENTKFCVFSGSKDKFEEVSKIIDFPLTLIHYEVGYTQQDNVSKFLLGENYDKG